MFIRPTTVAWVALRTWGHAKSSGWYEFFGVSWCVADDILCVIKKSFLLTFFCKILLAKNCSVICEGQGGKFHGQTTSFSGHSTGFFRSKTAQKFSHIILEEGSVVVLLWFINDSTEKRDKKGSPLFGGPQVTGLFFIDLLLWSKKLEGIWEKQDFLVVFKFFKNLQYFVVPWLVLTIVFCRWSYCWFSKKFLVLAGCCPYCDQAIIFSV